MQRIVLTKGKSVVVDKNDFGWLNRWKWTYHVKGYAYRMVNRKSILMHRLINKTPAGMETDHINRNGLDNRRSNLRSCTHSQNVANSEKQKNNTSGFKGVSFLSSGTRKNRWAAEIKVNGKKIFLGYFIRPEIASSVYQNAALKYHKEFLLK